MYRTREVFCAYFPAPHFCPTRQVDRSDWGFERYRELRQLTPAPPVAHTLSRVVASDHTPIGIRRNVRVHPGPSGRIFDTIDRKLEEVEWRLNYARNVNKPIPVTSAITTKKVNAPRRLTPMRLLNPGTHHQRTKSTHVPEINLEAGSPPLAVRFCSLTGSISAMAIYRQSSC
jgi:hypothetical protein